MNEIETGGPAFPTFHQSTLNGHPIPEMEGMALRDYFAAKAMQGRMAGTYPWSDLEFKPINGLTTIENEAALAYKVADAMLKARAKATASGKEG